MRKLLITVSACALISSTFPSSAFSETRYSTPPSTVLSGDLASPWILQLKNNRRYQLQPQIKTAKRQKMILPGYGTKPQKVAFVRPSVEPAATAVDKSNAPDNGLDQKFLPQMVAYSGGQAPGTIVIDTSSRFLYLVEENGQARRYGVGVGKEGFEWSGTEKISRRAEWPDWRPPEEMRQRERAKGRELPVVMAGGPENPLGAQGFISWKHTLSYPRHQQAGYNRQRRCHRAAYACAMKMCRIFMSALVSVQRWLCNKSD